VPADRSATQPVVSTGAQGYRQLKVHASLPLFY
jgi:hypothetical protein